MSDSRSHQFRPPLYQHDSSSEREQEGWDAYRKWMKSVGGKQQGRRAPIDHSVYSWKGYHSWADRVRQSWKPEDN